MAEPVNNRNFGGVNFNWNQVKSAKVTKHKDGKETYFIEFKTGVTAEYPLQNGGQMRSNSREYSLMNLLKDVVSGNDVYDTETELYGLVDAKVKGSKKDDYIVADGVKNCTIDVGGDNNDDHVDIKGDCVETHCQEGGAGYIKRVMNEGSDGNRIILDQYDTATNFCDGANKTTVEGPGIENRF